MGLYLIILFGLLFQNINGEIIRETQLSSFFTNSESRIVGGVPAPPGSGTHMAALLHGRLFPIVFCGASIISPRLLLTAAHCNDAMNRDGRIGSSFHGRIGSHRWNTGGQVVEFSHFKNHPEWDRENILKDGGLIFLANKIILNQNAVPIAMDFSLVDGGVKSLVTGFGRVEHQGSVPAELQMLKVETISGALCRFMVSLLTFGIVRIDTTAEICTLHSRGHGMCNGDSGSALVSRENRKQIGIVSWGFSCAIGAPDVFTRPSVMENMVKAARDEYKD